MCWRGDECLEGQGRCRWENKRVDHFDAGWLNEGVGDDRVGIHIVEPRRGDLAIHCDCEVTSMLCS